MLNPGAEKQGFPIPIANPDGKLRRYYFDDIASQSETDVLANPQQIQYILAFTAPLQATDKLLVHCYAGVSRSTAVACGILCQHGLTPSEAAEYVASIRPIVYPNQHVLRLFDEILGLEGQLVAMCVEKFFSS